MTRPVLLLLALLALLAGCGGNDGDSVTGNATDRAFVAEMVPHHEAGIEMAKLAVERGQSDFVRTLGTNIVAEQTEDIKQLRAQDTELADAGIEVGDLGISDEAMGMTTDTAALETADPFDRAFLDMMIPHHGGAVAMAQTELSEGSDPELKALAQRMVDTQTAEIDAMEAQKR